MTELLGRVLNGARAMLRMMGLRPWLAAVAGLMLLATAPAVIVYFPYRAGVSQPIPFSHRFHVSTKHLSCILCHPGVLTGERAGVPALETCMLCHKRIIVSHPKIQALRELFDKGEPVEWNRVNHLNEYVFFNHEVHVRAGFDCGRCHGDVAHMDRVAPPVNLNNMGFCVQCHRDEDVSHDCLRCHR